MKTIKLPKIREIKPHSQYIQYDKGFNHALMICKYMAREQGYKVIEIGEFDNTEG